MVEKEAGLAWIRRGAFVLLTAGTLAACSGAPSDTEVKGALEHAYAANTTEGRDVLASLGMETLLPAYESAEKLACSEAPNGRGYVCDVELTTRQFERSSTRVVEVRFVEGDSGWRVAETQPREPEG